MITVSCGFAHSFKIMRIPQPIIPLCAPLKPITDLCSGSGDEIEVPYIYFLGGQVPKSFELWDIAEDKVCEVHLYARVRILSEFREILFTPTSLIRDNFRFLSWVVEL